MTDPNVDSPSRAMPPEEKTVEKAETAGKVIDLRSGHLVLRTVYLPHDVDDELRVFAHTNRQSKNELIREAVRDFLVAKRIVAGSGEKSIGNATARSEDVRVDPLRAHLDSAHPRGESAVDPVTSATVPPVSPAGAAEVNQCDATWEPYGRCRLPSDHQAHRGEKGGVWIEDGPLSSVPGAAENRANGAEAAKAIGQFEMAVRRLHSEGGEVSRADEPDSLAAYDRDRAAVTEARSALTALIAHQADTGTVEQKTEQVQFLAGVLLDIANAAGMTEMETEHSIVERVAALRTDTARLDWLELERPVPGVLVGKNPESDVSRIAYVYIEEPLTEGWHAPTIREAIDAAMAASTVTHAHQPK